MSGKHAGNNLTMTSVSIPIPYHDYPEQKPTITPTFCNVSPLWTTGYTSAENASRSELVESHQSNKQQPTHIPNASSYIHNVFLHTSRSERLHTMSISTYCIQEASSAQFPFSYRISSDRGSTPFSLAFEPSRDRGTRPSIKGKVAAHLTFQRVSFS